MPDRSRLPLHFFGGLLVVLIAVNLCANSTAGELVSLQSDHAVTRWSSAAVQAVRDAKMGPPMAARALAIVHTCMHDAWAAYDEKAVGTQLRGALRRPASERTQANKERAVSYAAYRALVDLLPVDTETVYKPLMRQLGYDPNDNSTDIETPTGIGNVACGAVLEFRHHDGANQLGDMPVRLTDASSTQPGMSVPQSQAAIADLKIGATGPYGDWSGYRAVNGPATVPARVPFSKPLNPDHWQPLVYTDASSSLVVQMFSGAQWCFVKPFAMSRSDEFRTSLGPGPAKYGSHEYQQQAEELIALSANLSDRQKMIAEYWSGGSNGEQLLRHWMEFAQFVSARDHHMLDDDVKMLFALTNALFDASIAARDAKRTYDAVRPVTAISLLYRGKSIHSWGGPGKGTVEMDGSQWLPYQSASSPGPDSPEYVSELSAFSEAAARILALWTGSDQFGYSVTSPAGGSSIEPGLTPAQSLTLKWETFSDAANEAGMAGRYGGIHFARSDQAGRQLGRLVAQRAWAKAQSYLDGSDLPSFPQRTAAN